MVLSHNRGMRYGDGRTGDQNRRERRERKDMLRGSRTAAALIATAVLGAPLAVGANQLPDLSGEWHGTELCDELDNGTFGVFAETSPIFIAQGKGGRFRMLFRLADGTADVLYEGILKRVASSDEVQGVAIACGGAFTSSEVIRLRPIGTSDGQLFFNGESQFFTNDYPGAGGAVNFGTCKYVYQRTAATKPTVPRCKVSPFVND